MPKEHFVLEKWRGGQRISSETVLVVCQTSSEAEVQVSVAPNSITVSQRTNALRGYDIHQTFQLSPWSAIATRGCNFDGSYWLVIENWDYRKLRFLARGSTGNAPQESGIGGCAVDEEIETYLIVPKVTADVARVEASHAHLGSCALSMDASGRNGYVIWGSLDAKDPVEVKVVRVGPHTLLAQVIDPARTANRAASWWNADHLEIWMGEKSAWPELGWQFAIPLEEGQVQLVSGMPVKLPGVRRWAAKLPDGRSATILRIELPPQPGGGVGLTVGYSQSLGGRASKRMIATSQVKPADGPSLGIERSTLGDYSSENNVTCEIVQGAVEITGGPKKPVRFPSPSRVK